MSEEYENTFYRFEDNKGRYRLSDLTGPGVNPNDKIWRSFLPTDRGRSWSVSKEAVKKLVGEEQAKSMTILKKLDLLFDNNLIEISKNGVPSFKRYLDTSKGTLMGNIWVDISNIQPQAKERIGYPTQKPEKLLERIIVMASNEGDTVLDAFVGGGTTVAVADRINRKWIGIDQSVQAVKVTEFRLNNQMNLFSKPFSVQLHKYDYDTLRHKDAFEFESWIVQQFGGYNNIKQRGDLGLDGRMTDNTPIQVKRSDNIGRNVIDNFKSACERYDKNLFERNKSENKPVGYVIAFSFGKGAKEEIARLKNDENIIIKLVEVEQIVPIAKKPKISVQITDIGVDTKKLREIEFIAKGESEAGIEFFAWDFNYDPNKGFKAEILRDKEGKQRHKFKAGTHQIAVKVIDNQGLESNEIIKLKINGIVEQQK